MPRVVKWLDGHNGLVTALATLAIAVLTYFLANYASEQGRISENQFRAMTDQLNVMRRQLEAMETDQRPWISSDIEPASDLTFDDSGGKVVFRYIFRNVGHSPAFNLFALPIIVSMYNNNYKFVGIPIDVTRTLKAHCAKLESDMKELLVRNILPAWGTIIFPGEKSVEGDPVAIDIPKEDHTNILGAGNFVAGPMLFVSCIDYQSSADGRHHQIGEVFVLTENGRDIDIRDRKIVPKASLGPRSPNLGQQIR